MRIRKGLVWLSGLYLMLFTSSVFADAVIQSVQAKRSSQNRIILQVQLSQAIALKQIKSFMITDSAELVIDLPRVVSALEKNNQVFNLGVLKTMDLVTTGQTTRLVLHLNHRADYTVTQSGKVLLINLTKKNHRQQVKPLNVTQSSKGVDGELDHIVNIDFRRSALGSGQVVIDFSNPNVSINLQQKGKLLVVDFVDAFLPERLKQRYDVVDFGTPVQFIKAGTNGSHVELKIEMQGAYQYMSYQVNDQFIIDVKSESSQQTSAKQKKTPHFKGKRLSLNFQSIKVRAALALLAEFSGINLVASDTTKGDITLRLNNVPWDQALDLILKTRGLSMRRYGNVTLIAPSAEIASREKQDLTNEQEIAQLEPLQTEIIHLRFAKASEVAKLLKDKSVSLLSPRGNVSVDVRTNALVVLDTAAQISDVRTLIKKLDVSVKQVLIEARIVNVEKDFQRQLGIKFGVTKGKHLSGTLDGANGLAGGTAASGVAVSDRLNFNLPAVNINTTAIPASIGLALATLRGGYMLDLELSALESEGLSHTISTPRVITSNQHQGYFETGEEIPYQESSSSGATTVAFKKAVLSVTVTPHITPDNKIIMVLKVTQDTKGALISETLPPPINTNEVETQVLVNNGQTVVLGGFYKEEKVDNVERVPFFGEIPILGALFRHRGVQNKRTELLIFITPKIIKQSLVV